MKTLKVRVKDRHAKRLSRIAQEVNFVWNYVNDLSIRSIKERGKFLSAFDFQKYISGASKEMGLLQRTIESVVEEYVTRRKQFKKARLQWRKSFGSRRSLGWVPFKKGSAKFKDGAIVFVDNPP